MNDLLLELLRCFGEDISIFSTNKIAERSMSITANFKSGKLNMASYSKIVNVLNQFPKRDKVEIEIASSIDERIKISNIQDNELETAWNSFIIELNDGEDIDISLKIDKKVEDKKISIYKFDLFNNYLLALPIVQFLKFFDYNLQNYDNLIYELFDSNFLAATKSLTFRPIDSDFVNNEFNREEKVLNIKKASNFNSAIRLSLLPDDFYFIVNCVNNPYKIIFDKTLTLLSSIYIANSAEVNGNTLKLQISGQRTQTYEYDIDNIQYNENLYKIYDWIYTDGNAIDKAMLARNIISLHCKYTAFIDTDEKSFVSIKSNYELYQKENVDKYIEIKNKMTEFISQLIDQSKEIVLDIISQLEKNIFAFFTFIITVLLTNVISEKGLEDIFTKDVTYFTYLILCGSTMFIFITDKKVNYKIKKFKENYESIKKNNSMFKDSKEFSDVFDDKKIEAVENEIKIEKKRIYAFWIAFIVLIIFTVEVLSDYGILGLIKVKAYDLIKILLGALVQF